MPVKQKVNFSDKVVCCADDVDESIATTTSRKRSRLDEKVPNSELKKESIEQEKKHTLDSDEEDNVEVYSRMDVNKVEGQEDATEEYDGRIKIMPFNMKDDMDEGHFDDEGNFIFNKKEKVIRDEWLDNIEWDNVKNAAGKHWKKTNGVESDEDDIPEQKIDLKSVYTQMLDILKEKETVAGALKRLNSEKATSAADERKKRWAAKKSGITLGNDSNGKAVADLTALADSLISFGHIEAYELNSPRLAELISQLDMQAVGVTVKEATLDMFA